MKKKRKHRKLKNEFLLNTIITITFLFVFVMVVILAFNAKLFSDEIYFKNRLVSDTLVTQLDEHSESQLMALDYYGEFLNEDGFNPQNNLDQERLRFLLQKDEMFMSGQILDAEARVIYSSSEDQGDIGFDLSMQPYISVLKEEGDYYYSNTFYSKTHNRVMASLSYKTRDYYVVVYLDLSHFKDHINFLPIKDQLEYILLDHNGTIVSSSKEDLVEARMKFSFYKVTEGSRDDFKKVIIDDTRYLLSESYSDLMNWTVIILSDYNMVLKPIYLMVLLSIGFSVVMIALILVFQNKRVNYIVKKIQELNDNLGRIQKGVYDIVFIDTPFVEFNDMARHFIKSTDQIQMREEEIRMLNSNLESIVDSRTAELSDKNIELEALLKELQDTQDLLIESEKSASFSRLIAGIAHEINTPIGVGVTMSSYLTEASKKLDKANKDKTLTKSQFNKYIEDTLEVSSILLENLIKAGELITSFKTASNNNFTYDLIDFNFYALAANLVKSLKTQIKNKDISIRLAMDNKMLMTSYPSAYSQVLTNLISNAINHGFGEDQSGTIIISGHMDASHLYLSVKDDGRGIPNEIKGDIFEPFFSTNRSGGGMGLGLSIIQNLVVNKLKGSILIDSQEGSYTEFKMTFPLDFHKTK